MLEALLIIIIIYLFSCSSLSSQNNPFSFCRNPFSCLALISSSDPSFSPLPIKRAESTTPTPCNFKALTFYDSVYRPFEIFGLCKFLDKFLLLSSWIPYKDEGCVSCGCGFLLWHFDLNVKVVVTVPIAVKSRYATPT